MKQRQTCLAIERFYNSKRRHSTIGYLSLWSSRGRLDLLNCVSSKPGTGQGGATLEQNRRDISAPKCGG